MSGRWLEKAGFDLVYEVEVRAGKLTIQAV